MVLPFRALKRRSAAPLAGAARSLRRSWIVLGSFFRGLGERWAAVRAAVGPVAPIGDGHSAVERASFVRQELPGGIVVLRLRDSEPDTLDAWYTECTRQMAAWTSEGRLRYLHDVRAAEALKAHSIDRVTRVLKGVGASPARDGRGAILLDNRAVAATLDSVVSRYVGGKWQVRCFSDETQAIGWLRQ